MQHATKHTLTLLARRYQTQFLTKPSRRWNSTFDKREWSTPLAKTLANAIRVRERLAANSPIPYPYILTRSGHRAHTDRSIYAPSPNLPRWRILHDTRGKPRGIRTERRLHHVSRDIAGLWGIGWHMDDYRMDCTGPEKEWSATYRSRSGERYFDG